MVDRQRLARVLGRARQGIASLRRYAAGDRQALVDDEVRLGHSNAGAMVVLARNGVLPAELGATMADGVRFRNVLVHLYAEVDDERVVANLDQLDHVERFVACLSVLVDDGPD